MIEPNLANLPLDDEEFFALALRYLDGLTSPDDELAIADKVKLDVDYLQRQSFWFDFRILWLTLVKVLRRDGVAH